MNTQMVIARYNEDISWIDNQKMLFESEDVFRFAAEVYPLKTKYTDIETRPQLFRNNIMTKLPPTNKLAIMQYWPNSWTDIVV